LPAEGLSRLVCSQAPPDRIELADALLSATEGHQANIRESTGAPAR